MKLGHNAFQTERESMGEEAPGYLEMSDWLCVNHPDVFRSVRLLECQYFMDVALFVWRADGEPSVCEFLD